MFLVPTLFRNMLAFLMAFICVALAPQALYAVESGCGDAQEFTLIGVDGEAPGEPPVPFQGGDEGANDIFELESEEVLLNDSVWSPFVQVELSVSSVREGLVYRSGSSRGVDRPPQV